MKKLFLLTAVSMLSFGCSDFVREIKSQDDVFIEMRDSCRYSIVINNKDHAYVKNYELLNGGSARVIYLRRLERGCMFDTLIVGGTYGITIRR